MKSLIIVITLLALVACNSAPQGPQIVTIDPDANQIINLADKVETVELVRLELTDKSMLSRITGVLEYDDKYIVSSSSGQSICVFDKQGKFLYNIGSVGRADNEYLIIGRIMLDEKQEQLIVYDELGGKLLYYTISGEFVKVAHLRDDIKASFNEIINLPNGNFLIYRFTHTSKNSTSLNTLREITPSGEVVATHWQDDTVQPNVGGSDMEYAPNGKVAIASKEVIGQLEFGDKVDTIVMYDVQGPTAKTYAGTGDKEFVDNWINGKTFNAQVRTAYTDRYILSTWNGDTVGDMYNSLYDRQKGDVVVGRRFDFTAADGTRAFPSVVLEEDAYDAVIFVSTNMRNSIVVPIYADLFLASDKYAQYQHNIVGEQEIEEMNPVLQIWKFK
ncbi:MAG: 6-bladed beta-propeller [Alistipes sp.]|nr:6-bladed beta-propeller [Alistipes sp.]MBQ6988894.1 6-bladed beta-propeller [Alistipes sp.]